jgi:peptidoglycan/LPS O-acetylase OafA/YrhL
MQYRRDIDGLRTIAVLPVILFHTGVALSGGFVGVDIFYVISGFLITGIIHRDMEAGRFSFADFYARRVRRLYPALFAVLVATTAWAAAQMLWVDLVAYAKSLLSALFYVSNIYFYAQTGYFTEEATIRPLLHTWSLAVEEQFYLIAPLLLLALVTWVPRAGRLVAVAVLAVASFVLCVWLTGRESEMAFYLLPARAWELGLGAFLALAGTGWIVRRRWLAEVLGMAGLAAIAVAVFTFSRYLPFPSWRAAIPCLGAAAVIASGMVPGTLVARFLSLGPMVFVGRISYPLYLWHWPVIVMAVYGPLDPLSQRQAALVIGLTFALSVVTWYFVERPVRSGRLFAGTGRIFRTAAIASAVVAAVALGLIAARGLPGRHDPALIALVEQRGLLDAARWIHDRRDCHTRSQKDIAAGNVCIRGAEGVEPTFVLAGDSHADAASPAVFAAAADLGLSGYHFTQPGFLPTPGRYTLFSSSLDQVNSFMAFLESRPNLKTVVVTGWWTRARTGRSYRDDPTVFIDDEYDGSGLGYSALSLDHALDRLAQAFPDRHFVFLDDVPAGRTLDVKGYVRTFAVTGKAPLAGLPRSEADAQREHYEPALIAFAARHPNVTYARVFAELCGPDICPLFDADGRPIFRDGDHLSNVGAMTLAPGMKRVLATMLAQPG